MPTREQASRSMPAARSAIRALGAHVVDIGLLSRNGQWVIEVGVAQLTPTLTNLALAIEGVPVVVVDHGAPSLNEASAKARKRLRAKKVITN